MKRFQLYCAEPPAYRILFSSLLLCCLLLLPAAGSTEDIKPLVVRYHTLLEQCSDNKVVKEAKRLDSSSRQAFAAGKPEQAKQLLQDAITLLSGSEQSSAEQPLPAIQPRQRNHIYPATAPAATFNSPFGIFGPFELRMDGRETLPHEREFTITDSGPEGMSQLVFSYHSLLAASQSRGEDISQAKELDLLSRQALASGQLDKSEKLLQQAVDLLKKNSEKKSVKPTTVSGSIKKSSVSNQQISRWLHELKIPWVQEMPPSINDLPADVHIYTRVGREAGLQPPGTDLTAYTKALQGFVRENKKRIKYYEADSEVSGFRLPVGWQGHPQQYLTFLKATYTTVKEECPDCTVVLAGIPGVGSKKPVADNRHSRFLKTLLKNGAGHYFDAFSFKQHHAPASGYLAIRDKMQEYGRMLAEYDIDIHKIPVFLETATYDGSPGYPPDSPLSFLKLPPQTEREQAAGLVKLYIFSLSLGIDKIFWNELVERHNFGGSPDNPFNYYGLINNPQNDGNSHKKLAFFTLQNMVTTFTGADWQQMKTIVEKNGLHLYKVPIKQSGTGKNWTKNKNIWVVWNDSNKIQKLTLNGIRSADVVIRNAVPMGKSGRDIAAPGQMFPGKQQQAAGKSITVTVQDIPLYIEEK